MAQAGPNSITRRHLVLAGGAGIMVAPGTIDPDPIFAAIARHRSAESRLDHAIDGDDSRAIASAKSAVHAASRALVVTLPATTDGLLALLWYIRDNQEQGNSLECTAFLNALEIAGTAALARCLPWAA